MRRATGLLLVLVGVIALLYSGITYTHREKILDVGPLQVEKRETERIPIPPILGGLALAAGVVLILADRRGTRVVR